MERINVIGTSGSGKSTFAQALATKLGYPYIEMDEVFWKENWTESSDEEFLAKLQPRLAQPCWVLDGNYSRTTPIKWSRADTVVWLDLSRWHTHYRVIKRSLTRAARRQELWAGNRESFRKSLLSRDSVILWSITSYKRVKSGYAAVMDNPSFAHVNFVRLQTPAEVRRFLDSV